MILTPFIKNETFCYLICLKVLPTSNILKSIQVVEVVLVYLLNQVESLNSFFENNKQAVTSTISFK